MTSKHASLSGIIAASFAIAALAVGCHSESQPANAPANSQAAQGTQGENPQNLPSNAGPSQAPQQPSSTSEYGNPGASHGTMGESQGGTMGQPSQGTSEGQMGQQPGQVPQQGQMGQQGQTDQAAPNMTDGDIVAILAAADRAEIQAAQLAQTKAVSPDVKAYAGRLLSAHGRNLYALNQLERTQKITPNTSNKDAMEIETNAKDEMTTLRQKTGKDFDKEYIDSQVKAHEKALKAVDDAMNNAKSAQLKQQLQMVRPHLEQHLKDAQTIQNKL